jgi:hypothetical protein
MRVIERRLRALEERFVPRQRTESPLVAILRERQKRRAEEEGREWVEPDEPHVDTRGMTLAQVLRLRYKRGEPRTNDASSLGS